MVLLDQWREECSSRRQEVQAEVVVANSAVGIGRLAFTEL